MAPTGPFRRERVRASHQAMGVPITSSSSVVSEASSIVSQMAAQSALVSDKGGTPARGYS